MALTSNGVGTCGPDDNQAQAGHLITTHTHTADVPEGHPTSHLGSSRRVGDASEDGTGRGTPIIGFSHTAGIDEQASTDVFPTIKAQSSTSTATATAVRRLTPVECERLQGFPDNWTATSNGKQQADSARYRQMGNAVAVPCVEWIMRRLVEVDAAQRATP